MDILSAPKNVAASYSDGTLFQRDRNATSGAVATDLDAGKSVTDTKGANDVGNDVGPQNAATSTKAANDDQSSIGGEREKSSVDRSYEVDPETEALIFRAINVDNGEVIRQVPEEILLRIRAYNADPNASLFAKNSDSDAVSEPSNAATA